MAELLLENEFVSLQRLDARTLLYVRSNKSYATTADIARDFRQVFSELAKLNASSMGLLVDLRQAVGRNDAEFEAAHAEQRGRLLRAFRRVALVVASQAGKLQVSRYAASDGGVAKVFQDRNQALAWLAE